LDEHIQNLQKVNVWNLQKANVCNILNNTITESFFVEDNLTTENYLDMFQDEIVPTIQKHYSSKLQ